MNVLNNVLAAVWIVLVVWIIVRLPTGDARTPGSDPGWPQIIVLSLLFPVYYLAVSWYLSWRLGHRRGA